MTTSLHIRIRRSLGMIVAVAMVACVVAGSALAGGRPAASYYTKQQLQAMSERWAAKAAHDAQVSAENRPAASYYTKRQLEALSQRGAAKAAHDSLATSVGRPAASYYTKQQLEALSQRGAAKAAHDSQVSAENRSAASYYTKQQLQALSQRGAAKAAHDSLTIPVANPAASYYTKQQLQAMSQGWAAKAALSSVADAQAALGSLPAETRNALLARVGQTPVVGSSESSFGWSDFGIGAAGMLGLVLLAGGAFVAVRYGRRPTSVPAHRSV